jgi:hypothetical protein
MAHGRFSIPMLFAAAALIVGSGMADASQVPLAGDKARAAEVGKTFEKWLEAYDVGDLKGTMDIFDPEVNFAFQGGRDQTYADLEASYVSDFKTRSPGTVWSPEIAEIYADDRLAFVRSVW